MWQTSHVVIFIAVLLADDSGSAPTPAPTPNAAVSVSLNADNWDIAYSQGVPPHPNANPGGGWYFDFPVGKDGTHLVTTKVSGYASSEMQATIEITASSGALFDFTKEPANTCPTPPASHLYFQRRGDDMTGYGATEFYRWFSNPIKLVLKAGKVTLAVPFDPAQWSSVFGKFGNANAEANKGFKAALKDVANVGFTFGGGCFFGHGAFVTNGTARFIVTEFKVK